MNITFHGAARTVTGSKHIVHINPNTKILLDCGMFQGLGKETVRLNNEWGFEPGQIDHVIISHGHVDHIGLLPKLIKDGYGGKIYCTPPTADLIRIMLLDSARIQEGDVRHINHRHEKDGKELIKPLYTEEDVYAVLPHVVTIDYNTPYKITDDIELLYTDCGHLLGAAAVNLKLRERGKVVYLTFSGDIGRYRDILLHSPEIFPQAHYIIMESTYGDSLHDLVIPAADQLLKSIEHTCLQKRGKLIIPSFSLGRTQEILYILNRLDLEQRLPKLSYFVDSPLSIEATEVIKSHPECFNSRVQEYLKRDEDIFYFQGLHYIKSVDESKGLNHFDGPCVIISASGMAEAGRVKHHIAHNIEDPNNTILIVGYCEPESLGGRLMRGANSVSIYGKRYDVLAEVEVIKSLSAHGDYEDLCQWLACQDPREVRKLFLVHGEYEVQLNFKERLIRKGFTDVIIPYIHQQIGLGDMD